MYGKLNLARITATNMAEHQGGKCLGKLKNRNVIIDRSI